MVITLILSVITMCIFQIGLWFYKTKHLVCVGNMYIYLWQMQLFLVLYLSPVCLDALSISLCSDIDCVHNLVSLFFVLP